MQFLSPAQLILVLWLIAAAAPVATVLINGALVPLTASEGVQATPATTDGESATVDAAVSFFVVAGGMSEATPVRVSTSAGAVDRLDEAPAASVLHTALQRHRPKVA